MKNNKLIKVIATFIVVSTIFCSFASSASACKDWFDKLDCFKPTTNTDVSTNTDIFTTNTDIYVTKTDSSTRTDISTSTDIEENEKCIFGKIYDKIVEFFSKIFKIFEMC